MNIGAVYSLSYHLRVFNWGLILSFGENMSYLVLKRYNCDFPI